MDFLKSSVSGKMLLAALGAAVGGPLLLALTDSTAILAGGLFGYVFFLQYQAFRKQEVQKKQIAQEKMLREISFGLFNNVLEADISENRVLGENARKLSGLLGLNNSDNYEEIIEAVVSRLVREEFREEYKKIFSREAILKLYQEGQRSFEYEFIERSDGVSYAWVQTSVCIYRSFDTGTIRIISHVKNIQQKKEKELAILQKAQRDSLTNLYNKIVTKELIDEFLLSMEGQGMHAVYLIDIDNFKFINDHFGHAFGDAVLSRVAEKLNRSFRASDIVGRIGGDEFLVLAKNVEDRAIVLRKAEETCQSMHNLLKGISGSASVAISIGICIVPDDGTVFDEVYVKADAALYAAKKKGKNTFVFYNML
nr:GGDEF domain-containing protein [uncultured Anaeromusa sp.]